MWVWSLALELLHAAGAAKKKKKKAKETGRHLLKKKKIQFAKKVHENVLNIANHQENQDYKEISPHIC